MNGYRPAMSVRIACLIALSVAISSCSKATDAPALHASELKLETKGRDVLPSHALARDGQPYTGKAYDTFFGDKEPKKCTEWEGSFNKGLPTGEFRLYATCEVLDSVWNYQGGKWVKAQR